MTGTFWRLNVGDDDYSLTLDANDHWTINKNGHALIKYIDEKKTWFGIVNNKPILIQWPTFRDIVKQVIEISK